jgi:hypothetical protein
MTPNTHTDFVPAIDKSLLTRLQSPDNFWLDAAADNINQFNKVLGTIPRNYDWEFMTAEAFKQIGSSLTTPGAVYRHYWLDMLGQIEAFAIMSAWRLADAARSAIWAVGREDVLCAALMARAALETAASYAWLQSEIRPALADVAQRDQPGWVKYDDNGVTKDLEEKLLKVVFASRLEDAETFYNPTNIVTIIEKIAKKVPHQQAVATIYFSLCEVAHPNLAGRSIYFSSMRRSGFPAMRGALYRRATDPRQPLSFGTQ